MTFSFKPFKVSTFPRVAASVNTFVVSWNDAADIKELVCNEALVMPSKILSNVAVFFLFFDIVLIGNVSIDFILDYLEL